jgi:hypothetical protein
MSGESTKPLLSSTGVIPPDDPFFCVLFANAFALAVDPAATPG